MSDKTNSVDHPGIVELNVGGVFYTTTLSTLQKDPGCLLGKMFSDATRKNLLRDAKGKYFIDRDGVLFRYVLDYLRNLTLVLPENFHERERLKQEAEHFELTELIKSLNINQPKHAAPISGQQNLMLTPSTPPSGRTPGVIIVGYRGTFAFGRDGLADVKFRKLSRIIVCGRVSLCREVFEDTLNESRDPDRGGTDRYTVRFFLKHTFIEQAMDMLMEKEFYLVGSCGSGTNSCGEIKPGLDIEEAKWQHYNEFVFARK